MAADKLIRELIVEIKQKGGAKAATALEKVADGLQDAAAASELVNEQLSKMPNKLFSIERAAQRAASSLLKMNISRGTSESIKQLGKLESSAKEMADTMHDMIMVLDTGFDKVSDSVVEMQKDMGKVLERVEENLIDVRDATKKTTAAFDNMSNKAVGAGRAIGNTSGAARGATRNFAALAKFGGTLPIMYAAIASNAFVLNAVMDQIATGDQLNRLTQISDVLGAMTGVSTASLAKGLQDAVGGAISFEEALRQASQASAYGFDSKQIEQFGIVARRAATVLGVDMTDALNRVIKGVSKQEIELLDELGVTIRLNDAFTKYVDKLNAANTGIKYNINSLSSFQKQQAYANAVIEESNKRFGQLDGMLRATAWEQFAANASSALSKVQMWVASTTSGIAIMINTIIRASDASKQIDSLTESLKIYNMAQNDTARTTAMADIVTKVEEAEKSTKAWSTQFDQVNKKIMENELAISKLSGFRATDAEKAKAEALRKQTDALYDQRNLLKDNVEESKKLEQSAKATLELAKQDYLTKKPQVGKDGDLDVNRLMADKDTFAEYKTFTKNVLPDLQTNFTKAADSADSAKQASQGFAEAIKLVERVAASDPSTTKDALAAKFGLGANFEEAVKNQQVLNNYSKVGFETDKDKLAIQKAYADTLKSTGDLKKAEAAMEAEQTRQIQARATATEALASTSIKGIQAERAQDKNRLELLAQQNEQQKKLLSGATKVKDVSDKVVGIERQIALLKDETLDSNQYTLRSLELQLEIEKERQTILKDNVQKQKEFMQSKLEEARISRQIREEQFSQLQETSKRAAEQARELREASMEYGTQENIAHSILELERERFQLVKDAADARVALDQNTLADIDHKIEVLRKQAEADKISQDRNFQNATTGLLGGSFQSTMGMSPEMKQMQEFQNNQDGYAQAISNLQALNSEATAVGQSLGNVVNAMMQFSQGSLDTTSTIAAGMQFISAGIEASTNSQISAIDQAIAAEQKRDGKSAESKAKIKKMEAEKVKLQQEAAKKQILIQTAVAVMQAATSVPYPFSIPLMIAAAATGAMALAQASSASSSMMSDVGESSTASLSLGKRDNAIDVSNAANAGEQSYIRGERGTGSAGNFIPRAEGGNMLPGVGYITGENGVEVITPKVPSVATPVSELKSGGSSGRPIMLNVTAMDAKSFEAYLQDNSSSLQRALESALNEEGATLNALRR